MKLQSILESKVQYNHQGSNHQFLTAFAELSEISLEILENHTAMYCYNKRVSY